MTDWGDKAPAGEEYVVADRQPGWTAIWWGGTKAWLQDSPQHPATVPVTADRIVPKASARALYESVRGQKTWLEVPGGHNDVLRNGEFRAALERFRHLLPACSSAAIDSSNVEYSGGTIVRYDKRQKTPAMEYIDYGLGVFKKAVIAAISPDEWRDLAEVYQDLLAADQLAGFEVTERFYEIGSAQGIADAEAFLSGSMDRPEDSLRTTDTRS